MTTAFAPVSRFVALQGRGRVTIAAPAIGSGFGRISESFRCAERWAGERGGVVNAPPRPLLPAVRTVLRKTHGGHSDKKSACKEPVIRKTA